MRRRLSSSRAMRRCLSFPTRRFAAPGLRVLVGSGDFLGRAISRGGISLSLLSAHMQVQRPSQAILLARCFHSTIQRLGLAERSTLHRTSGTDRAVRIFLAACERGTMTVSYNGKPGVAAIQTASWGRHRRALPRGRNRFKRLVAQKRVGPRAGPVFDSAVLCCHLHSGAYQLRGGLIFAHYCSSMLPIQ